MEERRPPAEPIGRGGEPLMRRRDREIRDRSEIEGILDRSDVLRLGLCDAGRPYVVPMNFGRDGDRIYLHCAPEGRKLDAIRRNPLVCFEADIDVQVVAGATPCEWSCRYRSVIGWGTASIVVDREERRRGLEILLRHYAKGQAEIGEEALDGVVVLRVEIESLTGKRAG